MSQKPILAPAPVPAQEAPFVPSDAAELVLPVCPPQARQVLTSWLVMIAVMAVLLGTGMWLEY